MNGGGTDVNIKAEKGSTRWMDGWTGRQADRQTDKRKRQDCIKKNIVE